MTQHPTEPRMLTWRERLDAFLWKPLVWPWVTRATLRRQLLDQLAHLVADNVVVVNTVRKQLEVAYSESIERLKKQHDDNAKLLELKVRNHLQNITEVKYCLETGRVFKMMPQPGGIYAPVPCPERYRPLETYSEEARWIELRIAVAPQFVYEMDVDFTARLLADAAVERIRPVLHTSQAYERGRRQGL